MTRACGLVALFAIAACDHGAYAERAVAGRAGAPANGVSTPSAAPARPPVAAASSAQPKPASPGPTACTRIVKRDVQAWRAAMVQAKSAAKVNALLAELGLGPVDAAATLVGVDVEKAALSGGPAEDRIVVAHFAVETPRSDSMRVQLLRAQGKNTWCVVGSDLSTDQDFASRACLGGRDDDPPVQIARVHLLDAQRDTLRVVTEEGHCDGCGRAGHYELAYYDASGFELRRIYDLVLYDATYSGCPWPPVKEEIGSHELVGDFPRTIVATRETLCHDPQPDLPDAYKMPCSPKVDTIHSEYTDGRYVTTVESSRDGTQDSRLALADSAFRDTRHGAGWGNRCLSHLKAGDLEYARAACERGLADKPPDATRGALYYNLALIDAAAKDGDGACRNLSRSLIARPKNAPTRMKFTELRCNKP